VSFLVTGSRDTQAPMITDTAYPYGGQAVFNGPFSTVLNILNSTASPGCFSWSHDPFQAKFNCTDDKSGCKGGNLFFRIPSTSTLPSFMTGNGLNGINIGCSQPVGYTGNVYLCAASTNNRFVSGGRWWGAAGTTISWSIDHLELFDVTGNKAVYYPSQLPTAWTTTPITFTQPPFTVRTPPTIKSYTTDPGSIDLITGRARVCSNVTLSGSVQYQSQFVARAWSMYSGPNAYTANCDEFTGTPFPQNDGCWRGLDNNGDTILRFCTTVGNFDTRSGVYGYSGIVIDDGICTNDDYNRPQFAQYGSCNRHDDHFNTLGSLPFICYFNAAPAVTSSIGLLAMLVAAVLALQ